MAVELKAAVRDSGGHANGRGSRLSLRAVLSEIEGLRSSHQRLSDVALSRSYPERMIITHRLLAERGGNGNTKYSDFLVRSGRAEAIRRVLEQFRDIFKDGLVVLDIAAMDGTVLQIASEVSQVTFGGVYANNPFSSMLKVARVKLAQTFRDLLVCTARNPLESFSGAVPEADIVIVAFAAHHVENGDKRRLLINAARAVRRGGHLLLIEPWPVAPLNGDVIDPLISPLFSSVTFPTRSVDQLRDIVIEMGGMTEANTDGTSVPLTDGSKLYGVHFRRE